MKNFFKGLILGPEDVEGTNEVTLQPGEEKQLKTLINLSNNEEKKLTPNLNIQNDVKEEVHNDETTSPAFTVFIPTEFEEVKKIAEFIKLKKVVTINLEEMESTAAQRIMDFLTGAMSITGAEFIKISKFVYASVPENERIGYNNKR